MNDNIPSVFEYKSTIPDSLKDVDRGKREMVGMFANYETPDMIGDLSTKGMFDETWKKNKARVKHLYEHDTTKVVGKIQDLYDDNKGAYYKSIVGTHKFGDDVLDMAEAGLINEHSFGFVTLKSIKNKTAGRTLLNVMHIEVSSIGGTWGVHGNTPMLSVKKSLSSEETESLIEKMKVRYKALDTFCRTSEASDETIELLLIEIKQLQQNILELSVSSTDADTITQPQKGYKQEDVFGLTASIQNTFIKLKAI